jgi:hypothetical protein
VQNVAILEMSKENQIATFLQALSLLNQSFPREDGGKPMWEQWPKCNEYLPHVIVMNRRWQDLFDESHKDAELASLLSACTW